MNKYGLIGYPISHSFSPEYFSIKFQNEGIKASYENYPLKNISQFDALVYKENFSGLNVTIPYKELIIPYLDFIDPLARNIGAVNTVKFLDGATIGYNTDIYGFEHSLLSFIGQPGLIHSALVMGTGGSSKAVCFVLEKLNISFKKISRSKGDITYNDLNEDIMKSSNLIVNTTPLGMYPSLDKSPPLLYDYIDENYFLYDLIYNPEKTLFLSEGINRGSKVKNGYDMLILQAERAWQIWNQTEM